ncbi:hypothetical protein AVME950_23565 [Acidovorax sp. SUPP950]|uniref:hypothetical protein n=1 Tax=unclassified Acidovorax TaxID=2684926 RepID=UPI0023BCAA36|nr:MULTISPECIES: hypothetical protein [unclassified Acidovorax]GKS77931.1 hypothetical protein AVME950_23565 [Acidovorax sp. SUPP950]GKS97262.1 hypothetical protein AVAK2825_22025 [Acidovorax sp. SUPP2825]GKT02049.1 hypothetical protein AVKW3434_21690 [Acidovorax sp. SUPP3434]
MLDTGFHQATSLHSITPQSDLRVVSVVAQPDAAYGLETLWQVCSSLQRLGYPVAVLDGTARETDDAPGLAHLLAEPSWQNGAPLETGPAASSLAVIPAGYGMQRLARQTADGPAAMQALQPFFRTYALLVLYASAEVLAPLVRATSAIPLVIAEGGPDSVVQSYRQLKHMAMHAGVHCSVASILPPGGPAQADPTHAALNTLQRCAERHLGSGILTSTVRANHAQDVQRLALQLLENACTIGAATPTPTPPFGMTETAAHFARRH